MKPMKSLATALAVSASVTGIVAGAAHVLASQPGYQPSKPIVSAGGVVRCGTPEPTLGLSRIMNDAASGQPTVETPIIRDKSATVQSSRTIGVLPINSATIPVYVHIVGKSDLQAAVRDSKIAAQLDVLNAAYAGKQPKPAGQPASAQKTGVAPYRFQLMAVNRVLLAPDSDFALNGIIGEYQGKFVWLKEEHEFRSRTRRGGANALNIYLCSAPAGLLGTATFPADYSGTVFTFDPEETNPTLALRPASGRGVDGVISDAGTIPGGYYTDYNLGDTTVHEVGHWLGLYHTFQSDLVAYNPTTRGCVKSNDFVADTPAEKDPYFGKVPTPQPDTCTGSRFPGRDPYENFMDYSDDSVMYQFSPGQVSRMRSLNSRLRGL